MSLHTFRHEQVLITRSDFEEVFDLMRDTTGRMNYLVIPNLAMVSPETERQVIMRHYAMAFNGNIPFDTLLCHGGAPNKTHMHFTQTQNQNDCSTSYNRSALSEVKKLHEFAHFCADRITRECVRIVSLFFIKHKLELPDEMIHMVCQQTFDGVDLFLSEKHVSFILHHEMHVGQTDSSAI